jgi:hypothetical protein
MKQYIYPSVLQKECLMVIKKSEQKNLVIRYSAMSGIKLTVFLPLINEQIKHVITKLQNEEKSSTMTYSLILCHSNARCEELTSFLTELTKFCSDIVDVVCVQSMDEHDLKQHLKNNKSQSNSKD